MPIVSRQLVKLANRDDIAPGMKRWRVDGVDSRGNSWIYGPFFGTQGEAEVVRDSCWTTQQLKDADERDGMEFVESGSPPESYTRSDLSLTEWRRRLLQRFWQGEIETDGRFLCRIAAYIAGFTPIQIAGALNISEARATEIWNKAVELRDVACPAISSVNRKSGEA